MPCIVGLIGMFGIILIFAAVLMIVQGFAEKRPGKIAGGAALGLGTAVGLKYLADKEKERKENRKKFRQ